MLIDINAYVGHWPFMQLKYNSCAALGERMDRFGVDVSLISNLNGIFYKNTQSANKELHDQVKASKRYRDRFVAFAVINPIYAGWRRDMEESIGKLGMKGIRLYPQYHDYAMDDPSLIELVKRARDMNVPVAFTYRMVDSRQRSWMDVDYVVGTPKPEWSLKNIMPVIRAVPDARYMILNVANSLALDKSDADIFQKANVLIDTSGRTLTDLGSLLKDGRTENFAFAAHTPILGKERFAFGTHSPILDYLTGLLRIEALRDSEADAATKALLRSGNVKQFMGI